MRPFFCHNHAYPIFDPCCVEIVADDLSSVVMRLAVVLLCLAGFISSSFAQPGHPTAAPGSSGGKTLKQVAAIELPGPPGKRFDYLTIDSDDDWLLSAHLAAGLLYVIDMKTNKVVGTVKDVPGVEGVEYVPDKRKVYTSDWHENKVGVVDLKKMEVVKRIPVGDKPDGSVFAAAFGKLYVSNERGKTLSAINVERDEVVNTLHFDSETGMPQFDPSDRLLWVNLQDLNLIAVIDPANDRVLGRYPVGDCKGNHGMALDQAHRRAFLVCEGNDQMTAFDIDAHKAVASVKIPAGGDVVKYDAGLGRIYVACYSGAIAVIQQDDADHYRKLEDFKVQPKVHSLAVDPRTHRVYAPEQEENGKPAAKMIVYEAVR
jgi:YVTN family beta-propeller protein